MTVWIVDATIGHAEGLNVAIRNGIIDSIRSSGSAPSSGRVIDAKGGAIVPALWDHHVHLRSTVARESSTDLSGVRTTSEFAAIVQKAVDAGRPLRFVGYDSDALGQLDRGIIDALVPGAPPLRIQHRSGHHWVLNTAASLALQALTDSVLPADGVLWDDDAALAALPSLVDGPGMTRLLRRLRRSGITGATDMSITNTPEDALLLRDVASDLIDLDVYGAGRAPRTRWRETHAWMRRGNLRPTRWRPSWCGMLPVHCRYTSSPKPASPSRWPPSEKLVKG